MGAGVLCFEGLGSWFPPRSCRVPAAKDARSRGARVRAWAHRWRTSWMRVSSTSLLIAKSLSQMAIAVGALSSHRRGPVSRISAASGRHSRGGGGGRETYCSVRFWGTGFSSVLSGLSFALFLTDLGVSWVTIQLYKPT